MELAPLLLGHELLQLKCYTREVRALTCQRLKVIGEASEKLVLVPTVEPGACGRAEVVAQWPRHGRRQPYLQVGCLLVEHKRAERANHNIKDTILRRR